MPLKRSKKTSKKTLEEGSLKRRFRIRRENEAKEAKAKIKAEEEAKKEEARKHKIIYKYMTKLAAKLKEDDSTHFWVWADKPGFKKLILDYVDVKEALALDPEQYKKRHIAQFQIMLRHDKHGEERLFGDPDTWISVLITVYPLNDKAQLGVLRPNSCIFAWTTDDFKITKFSFKLLEAIMRIVAAQELRYEGLSGNPLSHLLGVLKKRKFKLDHMFKPLAGV